MAQLILRTNWSQHYRAVRFYFQIECVAAGQLDGRQEIVSQRYDQIASAISCILAFDFPARIFSLGLRVHYFLQVIR